MQEFYETVRTNVSFTQPTPQAIEYYRYFNTIILSLHRIYPAYRHLAPFFEYRDDLVLLEGRYTLMGQMLIRQFREIENMLYEHNVVSFRLSRFVLEMIPQL